MRPERGRAGREGGRSVGGRSPRHGAPEAGGRDTRSGARRPPRPDRPPEPDLPDDLDPHELDRQARARLRTLSKANSDRVAQHLIMAGRLMDSDPERAYEHAQAAVRRAGRVDIVREAAALTAYATGRYAEALRELRTVRRLSGVDAHRAIEADCERGLGRPDRALALIADAPGSLTAEERAELAIVEAGARADLGEHDAALSALERLALAGLPAEAAARVDEARHDALVALGRAEPRVDEEFVEVSATDADVDVLDIDDLGERA